MKRILVLIIAVTFFVSGCNAETTESLLETNTQIATEDTISTTITTADLEITSVETMSDDYNLSIPEEYNAVLSYLWDCISRNVNEPQYGEEPYGITGVLEVANYARSDLSYSYVDLDGDLVAELIILGKSSNQILGVYSYYDENVHSIFTGWSRSSFYLLSDLSFYNFGSSGAAYSAIIYYKPLDRETHYMVPADIYFSGDMKNQDEQGYWHTTVIEELHSPGEYSEEIESLEPYIAENNNLDYFDYSDIFSLEEWYVSNVQTPLPDGYYYIFWDPSHYDSDSRLITADVFEYLTGENFDNSDYNETEAEYYYHSVNGFVLDGTDQVLLKTPWDEPSFHNYIFTVSSDVVIGDCGSCFYYYSNDLEDWEWLFKFDNLVDYADFWKEYAKVYTDKSGIIVEKCVPAMHVVLENGEVVKMAINPDAHQDWKDPSAYDN